MAINVRLAESKSAWGRGDSVNAEIDIEDGPYHFIIPEIEELSKVSGKHIDQYADAFFEPHTIGQLLRFLRRAHDRAKKMKSVERIVIGIEVKTGKECRIDVQRKEVLRTIEKVIVAAEKAEMERKYLIFLGD